MILTLIQLFVLVFIIFITMFMIVLSYIYYTNKCRYNYCVKEINLDLSMVPYNHESFSCYLFIYFLILKYTIL